MNRDKGVWHAIGAFAAWGLLPFYWKQVSAVPALQVIGHRIVWSFITLLVVIGMTSQRQRFAQALKTPRVLRIYSLAALLIFVNWFVYVWGVNSGFIVETSLGYFINPLVSVMFGVVLLRERLRWLQWLAVGLAGAGVLYLTVAYGSLPWISLVLAFSFGSYGLVKKIAPLGSVVGLAVETVILLIPAVAYRRRKIAGKGGIDQAAGEWKTQLAVVIEPEHPFDARLASCVGDRGAFVG